MSEATSQCAENNCTTTQISKATIAAAGPKGPSLYEAWLALGNEGSFEFFLEHASSLTSAKYRLYQLDVSNVAVAECPQVEEALIEAVRVNARPGDSLIYETPASKAGDTILPVVFQWDVVSNVLDEIEVVLRPMALPTYTRKLASSEVCRGMHWRYDNNSGLFPTEFIGNNSANPTQIYKNPSIDSQLIDDKIAELTLLVQSNVNGSGESIGIITDVNHYLFTNSGSGLQWPETIQESEVLELINSFPAGTVINHVIYYTPLGNQVSIDIARIEPTAVGQVAYLTAKVPDSIDYTYQGDLTDAQYLTFKPGSEFNVVVDHVIFPKVINDSGSAINRQVNTVINLTSLQGMSITQDDLDNAVLLLQQDITNSAQAVTNAYIIAISQLTDAHHQVMHITGNAPASGIVPNIVSNSPALPNNSILIHYADYAVFYQATPWTEINRGAINTGVSGNAATQGYVDTAISNLSAAIATDQNNQTASLNADTLKYVGGTGNTNTIGWWQSPSTNLIYQFARNTDNTSFDPETLITAINGPDHWVFLSALDQVPFDADVAHYYRRDNNWGQVVLVGRKRFMLTAAANLVQAQTVPIQAGLEGSVNAGWEYLGER